MVPSWSLTCTICLLLAASSAGAGEFEELQPRVSPSVVLLELLDPSGDVVGSGTGFFISKDGLVVTNHHVVNDAYDVRAKLQDGTVRAILGVLASNEERDIAILQVAGTGYPELELGESKWPAPNTPVLVIGHPKGLPLTPRKGHVDSVVNEIPKHLMGDSKFVGPLIQISAPIASGSSGSPVLTLDGRVIGVAQSGFDGSGNLGFAVPIDVVKELWKGSPAGVAPKPLKELKELPLKELPLKEFPLQNLLISGLVYGVLGAALGWSWLQRRRRAAARFGVQPRPR